VESRATILRQQRELQEQWPEVEACLKDGKESSSGLAVRDVFLAKVAAARRPSETDYVRVIQSLDRETAAGGTQWLRQMVDDVTERAFAHLPSCRE